MATAKALAMATPSAPPAANACAAAAAKACAAPSPSACTPVHLSRDSPPKSSVISSIKASKVLDTFSYPNSTSSMAVGMLRFNSDMYMLHMGNQLGHLGIMDII